MSKVDDICHEIAGYLWLALITTIVCIDDHAAQAMEAGQAIQSAIDARRRLLELELDDPHVSGALVRSCELITFVEETLCARFEAWNERLRREIALHRADLERITRERDEALAELAYLRDRVNLAARTALAATHRGRP